MDKPEPKDGDLAIWSTYYAQADPLVVFRAASGDVEAGWVNLNVSDLPLEDLAPPRQLPPPVMPGIN